MIRNRISEDRSHDSQQSLGSGIEQMLGDDNGRNKTVPTEGEESENEVGGDGSSGSEEPR